MIAQADILAVARLYLGADLVERAPGDFWACCPFHDEDTPSFHVRQREGRFKCFGCGEAGDAISLVMRLRGVSYPEAARLIRGGNDHSHRRIRRMVNGKFARPRARWTPDQLDRLNSEYRASAARQDLVAFARELGLAPASLDALDVGWCHVHKAWSFPMRDGASRIVGFRLRSRTGAKFALRGGREGLFLPHGLEPGQRVLITEGPTDTAALLAMGFKNVVGRPSCTGGTQHLVDLVLRLRPPEIVVVADQDAPGQAGADALAEALVPSAPARIVTPPAKDIRDWLRIGARAADVQALIEQAPVRRLRVVVRQRR